MGYEILKLKVEDGIAVVTNSRPKALNALNSHFFREMDNMVADIKMLHFFTHISTLALGVLIILLVLSILIRNFWCRYLCPYGALLAALSIFSVIKIRRNDDTCTQCRHRARLFSRKTLTNKLLFKPTNTLPNTKQSLCHLA